MKPVASSFPWMTFFLRSVGMYVAAMLWIVRDARSHQIGGVIAAIITAAIGTLICYLWTRPHSN
jgi:hypothetical protein